MALFTVEGCRGKRVEVTLDGVPVSRVLWADTDNNCVCHAATPLRIESDEVVTTISRGVVEVVVYD